MQESKTFGSGTNPGPLSSTVDQANRNVHGAIDSVSQAVRDPVERLASGAHQATDRVAAAASGAAESLERATLRLRNSPTQVADSCAAYVREKPFTAVGMALAAGFLLGLIARR